MTVARNSVYSALGSGIPVIITIATLPLFIAEIGAARYGVIAIAWLILVYVGQADFGLGRAVTQRIASLGGTEYSQEAEVAASGIAIALFIALLTALAAGLIAHVFFGSTLDVAADIRAEAVASVPILAASTLAVSIFSILMGCLGGRERFLEISIFTLVCNSLLQLLPLATAYIWGPHLVNLLIATLVARVAGVVLAGASVWKLFFRSSPIRARSSEIKGLLNYGKWIMISTICRPAMSMADRFIIGAQLGAVAVAAYSVPYQIASRTQMVPQAIIRVLFPHFTALGAEEAKQAAVTSVIVLANLTAPIMVFLICLSDPLLRLWLGDELDPRSIILARLLLGSFWLTSTSIVAATYIQARGMPRFTAMWHVIQLPFYCAFLFIFAAWGGLVGIALVFLGRTVIDTLVLCYKAELWRLPVLLRLAPSTLAISLSVALDPILRGWTNSALIALPLVSTTLIFAYLAIPRRYKDILLKRLLPS